MYKDKFVVSILHDGYPVKETGSKYDRQVAIPFDSEYKIRFNPNFITSFYHFPGPYVEHSWSYNTKYIENSSTLYNIPNKADSSSISYNYTTCCSNIERGATIEGSNSSQKFIYSNLEVEEYPTIITLKLVGISDKKFKNKDYKYCTNCGKKLRQSDNYCYNCGTKA